MMTISNIIRPIIFFFFFSGLLSLLLLFIDYPFNISKIEVYLSLVFVFGSVKLLRDILKNYSKEKTNKERKKYYLYIFIFLGLVYSSYLVHEEFNARSVWLDEIAQFTSSTGNWYGRGIDIVERAAKEQQPPFSYLMSYLSYKTFGNAEISVRLFSIISYYLMVIFLPLLVYLFSRSLFIPLLSIFLLATNYQISHFSIEGRPFILETMLSSFYLFLIVNSLLKNKKVDSYLLSFLLFLMAITTSVQPVFLALAITISLFLVSYKDIRTFKSLFIPQAWAGVLFAPVAFYLYQFNKSLGHVKSINIQSKIFDNIVKQTLEFLDYAYINNKTFFMGLLLSSLIVLIYRKNDNLKRIAQIYFFSGIIFITTIISFLTVMINWVIYPRYLILLNLLPVVLLPFLIYELVKLRKKLLSIIVVLAVILSGGKDFLNYQKVKKYTFTRVLQTKSMYKYLKKETTKDDIVTLFNLTRLGEWRANDWLSFDIYYDQEHGFLINKGIIGDIISYIPDSIFKEKENRYIYLVTRKNWNEINLEDYIAERILNKKEIGDDYKLLKIKIKDTKAWKEFIAELATKIPEEYRFMLYEILLAYSVLEQNEEDFNFYIAKYEKTKVLSDDEENNEFKNGFSLNRKAIRARKVKHYKEMYLTPNRLIENI